MEARKIMLSTPLLRWYLNHGLEVTRLYEVIKFSPIACFEKFIETCTNARRRGDIECSDSSLISDT